MVKGGTIIDIVVTGEGHLWCNVFGSSTVWLDTTMVVLLEPQGMPVEVGDGLWWGPEGDVVYWTPRNQKDRRMQVQLPRVQGTPQQLRHPDIPTFNPVKVKV